VMRASLIFPLLRRVCGDGRGGGWRVSVGVPGSRREYASPGHWTWVERETKVRVWKQLFRDSAFVTILQQSPLTHAEFEAWRDGVAAAARGKGGTAVVVKDVRGAWLAHAWKGTRWAKLAPGLSGTVMLVAGDSMDVIRPVNAAIEAKYGTFFVPVATVVRGSGTALSPEQVVRLGKLDAETEWGGLVGLLDSPGRSIVDPLEEARGRNLLGTLTRATAQPVDLLAQIEHSLKEKEKDNS